MEINLREFKIICGAMSWISDPNLVAAVSNAKVPENKWGGRALGVLASGAMNAEQLNAAIKQIKIKTSSANMDFQNTNLQNTASPNYHSSNINSPNNGSQNNGFQDNNFQNNGFSNNSFLNTTLSNDNSSNNNFPNNGSLNTSFSNICPLNAKLENSSSNTNSPYAVNLIYMNPNYQELVQVCAANKVPIIIIAAGMPRADKIDQIKQTGAKVIAFANSLIIARDLIKNGIDAIILEGAEAGGHVGSISISVLIQEILFEIADKIPVIVAGGIGRGELIKHYLSMGASGVQLGTRFVCAYESPMHRLAKNFYIKKKAKDTVVVSAIDPALSVIPVRVINNRAVQAFYAKQREAIDKLQKNEFDQMQAQLHIEHFWSGSLYKGVIQGDLEYGSLMAGQSLSFVEKEESVQEIIDSLYKQME